jgi:hypothetical protein
MGFAMFKSIDISPFLFRVVFASMKFPGNIHFNTGVSWYRMATASICSELLGLVRS